MTLPHGHRLLAQKGLTARGLTRAEAAAYVGLSPRTFSRRVADGTIPASNPITGRWDRIALDRFLDGDQPSAAVSLDAEIMAAIDAAK